VQRWASLWWALALLLWVAAGFAVADRVTSPGREPTAVADASHYQRLPADAAPGRPRAFFLLIDSLRDGLATDARVMPQLAALEGLRATVRSSQDAVTVPAIRAMFTGRERFTIFGFVKNFTHGRESVESLFTQWRAAGVRVAVYSDGSFAQFGADIPDARTYPGDSDEEQDLQDEVSARALAEYLSGAQDVVVAHVIYGDHAAHSHGVGAPAYDAAFGRLDAWIGRLADAIPADETLVIAGDHGHTASGRHALGLDIPTYALYRGPRFAPVTVAGIVPITTHRAWLGWATGMAPAPTSEAPWLPATLRGDAAAIDAITRAAPPTDDADGRWFAPIGVLGLGAALALLWGQWWGWWRGRRRWWLAGAVGVVGLIGATASAAALFVSAAWLCVAVAAALTTSPRRAVALRWSAALIGAAFAAWLWGWGLALARPAIHEPRTADVQRLWLLVILGAALWTARRHGRVPWMWLAAPALLLYPTTYRYGSTAGIWSLALAWLAATCAAVSARSPSAHLPGAAEASALRRGWWLLAAGAALCWQPFAVSDAHNFAFSSWSALVEALGPVYWYEHHVVAAASIAALLVTLGSPRWTQALCAFALSPLLAWATHRGVGPQGLNPGVSLGLIAAAVAAAWSLHPRRGVGREGARPWGPALYRAAWVSGVLLALHHLVRVPAPMHRAGLLMLAGLALAAALLKRLRVEGADLTAHRVALSLLAVAASGWMTLAWTFQHLEWAQAYDWFSAAFVEDHVLVFVPLIALKYALPAALSRGLLADALGPEPPAARRWLWTAASVKALSLVMISLGVAMHLPDTSVYLESVQQAAIFIFASFGLCVPFATSRAEGAGDHRR
jgi:hypothetical protein